MRLINKLPIIFIALFGIQISPLQATEIVHYKNVPVTIELREGQERSIRFGDHVQVGVSKGQQMKRLFRVQSAQGTIHILPHTVFDKNRVQIKRMSDGRVILLDLISSKEDGSSKPLEEVKILLESENTIDDPIRGTTEVFGDTPLITPVDLTRFASQRLYGPARLHKDVQGITSTSLGVKGAVRIFKGINKHTTISKPIVAYQGGGYFLTGIAIKNTSESAVQLNYLDLNIPFSHAVLQHHTLNPNGMPGDSTVLYLVSEKNIKETLYPWTYYLDKKSDVEELARKKHNDEAARKRRLASHTK